MVRILTLFIFSLFLSCLLLGIHSPILGFVYFLSIIPLALFPWNTRRTHSFAPIFMAAGAFFIFYFIRPLVLIPNLGYYPFGAIPTPQEKDLLLALPLQGLYSFSFLSGLYFILHIKGFKLHYQSKKRSTISCMGPLFLAFIIFILALWSALSISTGAGQKLEATKANLLLLLLPISLIIPAAFGYLSMEFIRKLSVIEKTLVAAILFINASIITFSGSKAAIFLLILFTASYLIFTRKNFKVHLFRTISIAALAIFLIAGSVILANSAKYSSASINTFSNATHTIMKTPDLYLSLANKITQRFNGYDGTIAVLSSHPTDFESTANWVNIIKSSTAKLVPGLSVENRSLGKAVAVEFAGRSVDASHASALGLVGVIYYMHGPYLGFGAMFLIGIFFGGLFRAAIGLTQVNSPERLTLLLALTYTQSLWISSGNFDSLIQKLIITAAHILFYYAIVFIAVHPLMQKKRRSASPI